MDNKIGFVFDLDGTLINSTDIGKVVKKEIYKEFNIRTNDAIEKEIEQLTYEIMHGENRKNLGAKLMWAIFKKLGLSFFHRVKALKMANRIFKQEIPKIKLYEGTRELFEFLDTNSIDYAIATTSSKKEVDDRLKKFPDFYIKFAGKIISRNDVKKLKPHPESIELAAKLMEVTFDNLVMVGDMHSDILMGKKVGAITIGVTTGLFSRQKLLEINPDFIFDSVAEISENFEQIKDKLINN
ncbi:MAG: HAD family phosphatase [Promethearchaeota archaeon]|nr:MAG: HAD family phosphatase [Candidatus Lokiarchaeota archaeon]